MFYVKIKPLKEAPEGGKTSELLNQIAKLISQFYRSSFLPSIPVLRRLSLPSPPPPPRTCALTWLGVRRRRCGRVRRASRLPGRELLAGIRVTGQSTETGPGQRGRPDSDRGAAGGAGAGQGETEERAENDHIERDDGVNRKR